jgi:ABC-type sugar transport system ATPase subunit
MGECQLVQIARALRHQASVVIMDEPTSSLTERETSNLFDILRSLKEEGLSVIYISHGMEELFKICDTVTVLKDGKWINTLPIKDVDKMSLVNMMVGRKLGMNFPDKEERTPGDVYLKAEHMTQNGNFYDVSFEVRRGEVLGFGGLIGAGRTEIMDAIFGMTKLTEGSIYIEGKPVTIKHPSDAIRNHIAYVTEDRHGGMVLKHSVFSNMTLASIKQFIEHGIFINDKAARQACAEQIEATSIKTPSMNTLVNDLSGGNQQKVIFGKWLMKTV